METFDTADTQYKGVVELVAGIFPRLEKHYLKNKIFFCGKDRKGISLQNIDYLKGQHALSDDDKIVLWFDNDYDAEIDGKLTEDESLLGTIINAGSQVIDSISDTDEERSSILFTTKGISQYVKGSNGKEQNYFIEWRKIERAATHNNEIVLYADKTEDEVIFRYDFESFCRHENPDINKPISLVVELINQISCHFVDTDPQALEHFELILSTKLQSNWAEALSLIEAHKEKYPQSPFLVVLDIIECEAQLYTTNDLKAVAFGISEIEHKLENECPNLTEEARREVYACLFEFKGVFAEMSGDPIRSLWETKAAMFLHSSKIKELNEHFYRRYNDALSSLTSLPYNNRKVLYITDELPPEKPQTFLPMLESEISKHLEFPPGHPVIGEFYIGHPYKPETYFPIKDYENELFKSQVMELNNLMQCLGATRIGIRHIKGELQETGGAKSSSVLNQDEDRKQLIGDIGIHSGQAEKNAKKSSARSSNSSKDVQMESLKKMVSAQILNPAFKPYVPDGLTWYNHNAIWQGIVKQRLSGSLFRSEISISTRDTEVVNEKDAQTIEEEFSNLSKGEYENPIFKIGGASERKNKSKTSLAKVFSFNKHNDIEWLIEVEFAPIESLTKEPPKTALTNSGQKRIGTSIELFDENEKKYLELLEDSFEGGSVPPDLRKMLDKQRERLGVNPERAKHIEDQYLKSNSTCSTEEEAYLCLLKDALEDGGMSPNVRQLLEKRRAKLGISLERALELENKTTK